MTANGCKTCCNPLPIFYLSPSPKNARKNRLQIKIGTINPISEGRVQALEDLLPNTRFNLEWAHTQDNWRALVRTSYFGEWDDTGNGVDDISAEVLIDVEFLYSVNENFDVVAGVSNLFDTYPDENPFAGSLGQLYPEASPFGFNGGQWYLQARLKY